MAALFARLLEGSVRVAGLPVASVSVARPLRLSIVTLRSGLVSPTWTVYVPDAVGPLNGAIVKTAVGPASSCTVSPPTARPASQVR